MAANMARAMCRGAMLMALLSGAAAMKTRQGMRLQINPIRRVVTMLQMMQKKIVKEGEVEEELFEKFMCYCKTGTGTLAKSIAEAQEKIPQLQSDIEAALGQTAQLSESVSSHKKDRAAAKTAMAEATALREKEAKAFADDSAEAKANIGMMATAIPALEKGMAGFLQTPMATKLKKLVTGADNTDNSLGNADRELLVSFLVQGQSAQDEAEYAPQSGEIVGILKQLKETMEKDLATATAAEEDSIKQYEALMAAKQKEVEALTKAIEEKMARLGELGVKVVNMKEDLEDTTTSLAEDTKFLADLKKSCATKDEEWKVRCKTRADELVAISDTIKLLNDDDALELFKKTLPTPTLMQLQVTSKEVRQEALQVLRKGRGIHLDLIALAIRGRKVSFEKVIEMIDEMVGLLGKEQNADDEKKAYCLKEIDAAEDTIKELKHDISDLGKSIEEGKATVEALTEEIAALVKGIEALDKQVAEATATRKAEHEDYVSNMAASNAAKELIKLAKNRMNKFYNPKMYKAPPKRELSDDERITVNMGGTLAPTAPPSGISGTDIVATPDFAQVHRSMLKRGAPPPPPETFAAYSKKSEETGGVLAMMDTMVKDLAKEMTEMELDEKDGQEDYEQFIADSAEKRASDAKSISEKEAAKADLEANLEKLAVEQKSKMKEEMASSEALSDLHIECDWLVKNYNLRKEARASEVDSLGEAKAVLSGADYSLLQTGTRHKTMHSPIYAH